MPPSVKAVSTPWFLSSRSAGILQSICPSTKTRYRPITTLQQSKPWTLSFAKCRPSLSLVSTLSTEQSPRRRQGQDEPQQRDEVSRNVDVALPPNVEAIYYTPAKLRLDRAAVLSCRLQFRSYSTRNVEFMADVALRAAFYLRLPTIGPIPIPQTIERWTVPRSNFIFKKSQENFERITIRRHIEIWDGHPENIEILLGFLRKHCYHGVGIKADVWDNAKLGISISMDSSVAPVNGEIEKAAWGLLGPRAKQNEACTLDESTSTSLHRAEALGVTSSHLG